MLILNNPVSVSLLSGDRKLQICFLGNHHSGGRNLYHKSIRMIAIVVRYTKVFADYKKFKECDIAITVSKYRDKIPEYIYEKLLTVRVELY